MTTQHTKSFRFYTEELRVQLDLLHTMRAQDADYDVLIKQEHEVNTTRQLLTTIYNKEWLEYNKPHAPRRMCTFK